VELDAVRRRYASAAGTAHSVLSVTVRKKGKGGGEKCGRVSFITVAAPPRGMHWSSKKDLKDEVGDAPAWLQVSADVGGGVTAVAGATSAAAAAAAAAAATGAAAAANPHHAAVVAWVRGCAQHSLAAGGLFPLQGTLQKDPSRVCGFLKQSLLFTLQ